MHKECPYCKSLRTKKNGKKNGKQMYKCSECGTQFVSNRKVKLENEDAFATYVKCNMSAKTMASIAKCSVKTVRRRLDCYMPDTQRLVRPAEHDDLDIVVIADVTFLGKRNDGLMIFIDAERRRPIHWKFVAREVVADYKAGLEKIKEAGWHVAALVCDGKKGVAQMCQPTAVQMCQVHQQRIVRRNLTGNPKHESGEGLMAIAIALPSLSKDEFREKLSHWKKKWGTYMSELMVYPYDNKPHYVHKRLRSAYNSLSQNTDRLFTFEDNSKIPKTTNAIESLNSRIKNRLNAHHGMSVELRNKLIDYLLQDEADRH